jgi:hypothetical protein
VCAIRRPAAEPRAGKQASPSPPPAEPAPPPKRTSGFVIPKKAAPPPPPEFPAAAADADAPLAIKFTLPPGCCPPSLAVLTAQLGELEADLAHVWMDDTAYPPAIVVPFRTPAAAAAALARVSGREDEVLPFALGTTSALFRPAPSASLPHAAAPASPRTAPAAMATAWYAAPPPAAAMPAAAPGYDPWAPALGAAMQFPAAAMLPPPPTAVFRSVALDPRRVRAQRHARSIARWVVAALLTSLSFRRVPLPRTTRARRRRRRRRRTTCRRRRRLCRTCHCNLRRRRRLPRHRNRLGRRLLRRRMRRNWRACGCCCSRLLGRCRLAAVWAMARRRLAREMGSLSEVTPRAGRTRPRLQHMKA